MFKILKKNKNNSQSIDIIINNICSLIGVNKNITENVLFEYNNHHKPLTLQAFSDALSRNGIKNRAIQIEKERIKELPKFTLLYIDESNEFIIFEACLEENIVILNSKKVRVSISYKELFSKWNGVSLLISRDFNKNIILNSELHEARNNKTINFTFFSVAFTFLLFLGSYFFNIDTVLNKFEFILISILNILGIYISSVLIKSEFIGVLEGLGKFCHIGKYFDCINVSKSKLSKIFKYLTLAELGYIYFLELLLLTSTLFFLGFDLFLFISILYLIPIILIIISVIYQAFFLKKWCLFCLVIDLIIIIQILILINNIKFDFKEINIFNVLILIFISITSLYILFAYKNYLKRTIENKSNENSIKTFNRDIDIIDSVINKQSYIEIMHDESDIILGNKDSDNQIVFILNPFCKKCKMYFREIQILLSTSINAQIIIRLTLLSENNSIEYDLLNLLYIKNTTNNSYYVYKKMEEFYLYNHLRKESIYKYIYENRNLLKQQETSIKIENNNEWCKLNKISGLPTVIVNGKIFPNIFPAESIYYYCKKIK